MRSTLDLFYYKLEVNSVKPSLAFSPLKKYIMTESSQIKSMRGYPLSTAYIGNIIKWYNLNLLALPLIYYFSLTHANPCSFVHNNCNQLQHHLRASTAYTLFRNCPFKQIQILSSKQFLINRSAICIDILLVIARFCLLTSDTYVCLIS